MKKLLIATIVISYGLWSCSGSGTDPQPTTKTLCDSVSYTGFVKPILSVSCNTGGCHENGAGGLDLRTYNTAKAATESGNLIKSINHVSGVPAMPQAKPKLSQRQLDIFDCWKAKGYPN